MGNYLRHTSLAAFCVAAVLISGPASAFDATGNPVADALLSAIEAGGVTDLKVEAVTGDGGNTRISGLSGASAEGGETTKTTIGSIEFVNGAVNGDGGITADEMKFADVTVDGDGAMITVKNASIRAVALPGAAAIKADEAAAGQSASFQGFAVDQMTINADDGTVVPISGLRFDGSAPVDGIYPDADLKVMGITLNRVNMKDPEFAGQMQALGYEQLVLDLQFKANWDSGSEKVTLNPLQLVIQNAGTLTLSGDVSGVSADMMRDLQSGAQKTDPMAAMEVLKLDGLKIRYDNNTLAERMLDMQAKQMNVTKDQLVAQLVASMPIMLAMLDNKALQDMVTAAATKFLNDPKSITAIAAPAQPVAAGAIMGAAMMAPGSIADLLSVKISAND